MEMFAVFGLGCLISRLLRSSPNVSTQRIALISALVLAYFAFKLNIIFQSSDYTGHQQSLFEVAGVDRSIRSEDLKKLYRSLARERHPDRNPQENANSLFTAFQKAFDTIENPTDRMRYELYGGVTVDSARTSLIALLPFYISSVVMTYCLTCDKESLIAGRAALIAVLGMGYWEWKSKAVENGPILGYVWMPLTIYEQFEALRALFYPALLAVYALSCHLNARKAALKRVHKSQYLPLRILLELKRNTAKLQALKSPSLQDRDLDEAIEQNSKVDQLASQELGLVGQKKSTWRMVVSVVIFFGIFALSQGKQQAETEGSG